MMNKQMLEEVMEYVTDLTGYCVENIYYDGELDQLIVQFDTEED